MHPFQLKPASRLALINNFDWGVALGRLMDFVVGIFGRRNSGKSAAVPQYEGHAWCDSLERHLNADIVACRRTRL